MKTHLEDLAQLLSAGRIRGPVLDLGCGAGEQAMMLASHGLDVVAVDVDPVAIDAARTRAAELGLSVDFRVANVLDLGGLGQRFNTVLASMLYQNLMPDVHDRAATELACVAAPGAALHTVNRGLMKHTAIFSGWAPEDHMVVRYLYPDNSGVIAHRESFTCSK